MLGDLTVEIGAEKLYDMLVSALHKHP